MKTTTHIPNIITGLNLLSGLVSIVLAFEGYFMYASVAIIFSAFFDFFDGLAARMLHAYSETGKQLDSLADVVSFGVAPAMIIWNYMLVILYGGNHFPAANAFCYCHLPILLTPLLIPVFSAVRLARFNIDTRQTENFIGLPTPANALLLASISFFTTGNDFVKTNPRIVAVICLVLCYLMVCEIPMFSLKFKNLKWSYNKVRYIFSGVSILLFIFFGIKAIAFIILLYIGFSVFLYLFSKIFNKN